MGVPRYMVAMSLQMVLAQRLVRVICPHCSEPHRPEAHELAWLERQCGRALDAPPVLRRGAGCNECNHTGFSGRTGVYEFLEMTRELVEAMNHQDPLDFTQAARRQMVGQHLGHDAARLVLAGRTTVAEAMRVSHQVAESPGA
jgi:MSHA biogenesis protein MshE